MDKISKEYDAELQWERTVKAQPKEVVDKIIENRKLNETKRGKK